MNLKKIYYSLPYSLRNFVSNKLNAIVTNSEDKFINSETGKMYGLNKNDKINIVDKVLKVLQNVTSATNLNLHLTIIDKILEIKPSTEESYLVEAGCYFGATTCSMSIASKFINKKLIIYDSFAGLPDDDKKELKVYNHLGVKGYYKKGMYSASKKNVENNLKKFGEHDICILREGLFENTMQNHKEKISFLFLDVDLVSSTLACIKYLWPHVLDNHFIFTDDACDLSVVRIWFDEKWWNERFNSSAPGFVGSGCGLPINHEYSSLGYTIKNLDKDLLKNVNWLEKN